MHELALKTAQRLLQLETTMTTAESCTGGWIAKILTDIPGSSQWFERGFVTYSNAAKMDMLGVKSDTLEQQGAVSEAVVREMASGALTNASADVSVAVSGVAGPGGGTDAKPVGTVWLAWATTKDLKTLHVHLSGDRGRIREQTVELALQGVLDVLAEA